MLKILHLQEFRIPEEELAKFQISNPCLWRLWFFCVEWSTRVALELNMLPVLMHVFAGQKIQESMVYDMKAGVTIIF